MPYINRKKIKEEYIPYKHKEVGQSFYSSSSWYALRNNYLSTHPLCECCYLYGRVTPAKHIHHKKFFMSAPTDEERWKLFLDYSNLMSVCEDCHHALHRQAKLHHTNSAQNLSKKEYEEAHNLK